jgi:hypothetical protein
LHFSKPIEVNIAVDAVADGKKATIQVQHHGQSIYSSDSITLDPNATCSNGIPSVL